MRVVQLLSHSIEAYDQLRLYHSMGVEPFDIGGYIDPAHPHDNKRPALPEVPFFPDLKDAIDSLGTPDNLTAAQERIPDALLDWADVIVAHHYLERVVGQWPRLKEWMQSGGRVIWRTVGQSVENNERMMRPLRDDGLEIVRYSPKERNIPGYAGEDALIRFYKDPADYGGWTGEGQYVLGFGQHYVQRDPWTNYRFFRQATEGLPTRIVGPGSEVVGGPGEVPFEQLKAELRRARVYLYTGTQPASYTLGLIEAMMTGLPVVMMGASWFDIFPGHDTFEGPDIYAVPGYDAPRDAQQGLAAILSDDDMAGRLGRFSRSRAIELFGFDTIRDQWAQFLGVRVAVAA